MTHSDLLSINDSLTRLQEFMQGGTKRYESVLRMTPEARERAERLTIPNLQQQRDAIIREVCGD